MAYRIMLMKCEKDNYASLYQFMTTTIDGTVHPVELDTKDELDAKVETMLNDGGYAKSDFIVVKVIDYMVEATDYSDDEEEEETEETVEEEEEETTDDADSDETTEETTDDDDATSSDDTTEE